MASAEGAPAADWRVNNGWQRPCFRGGMANKRDIEDRAFRFALQTVQLSRQLITRGPVLRVLALQTLKAGTSIGANLAEAIGAQTKADFIHKCCVARKEAFEVRYWLRLVLAAEPSTDRDIAPLIQEAGEFAAILTTMVKKARSSPARG